MKRIIVMVFGIMVAAAAIAQTAASTASTSGPKITWDQSTHNFGDITQGDVVEYTYKFTNTGNEPLIITNVNVTCGCTTPKGWPRDPVAAGAKSEIVISFNSTGKMGMQNKVITIISNAVNADNSPTTVSFTTNVLQKAATPQ